MSGGTGPTFPPTTVDRTVPQATGSVTTLVVKSDNEVSIHPPSCSGYSGPTTKTVRHCRRVPLSRLLPESQAGASSLDSDVLCQDPSSRSTPEDTGALRLIGPSTLLPTPVQTTTKTSTTTDLSPGPPTTTTSTVLRPTRTAEGHVTHTSTWKSWTGSCGKRSEWYSCCTSPGCRTPSRSCTRSSGGTSCTSAHQSDGHGAGRCYSVGTRDCGSPRWERPFLTMIIFPE